MSKILSIVIPTHERHEYIFPFIKAISSISDMVELVISDTSQNNKILEHYNNNLPPFIKLVRPGVGKTVVDNFNAGLSAATGDYITFIGDDDFVSNEIISVVYWAKRNNVETVGFTFPVEYFWPCFEHRRYKSSMSGILRIKEYSGRVSKLSPIKEFNHSFNDLGRGVLGMPRAYAGIISRELANRIVNKHEYLFGGVSPDIYSSTLLSHYSKKSYLIDYPIIIPGASGKSTSGDSAKGKHIGGLTENNHLSLFKNLIWDKKVPEFYSVPTVWGYSQLKAIEKIDGHYDNKKLYSLYAKCFIKHSSYSNEILSSLRLTSRETGFFISLFLLLSGGFQELVFTIKKVFKVINNRYLPSKAKVITNIEDTCIAYEYLVGNKNNIKKLELDDV
ncbi:glycosyltransferase family 2 protein [Photobacterium leiognathi subsp. mandapamensis]|uniref:glycosyltransferase family 2 protein n=1 Tax=Photobacterium leiognathi TaxID=553611 RepID=UPI003AF3F79F